VPFSPAFDYIQEVFVPALHSSGADVQVSIERYGFYPRGGGRISATISPANDIRPIHLEERSGITKISVTSVVGSLPLGIAERQCNAAVSLLQKNRFQAECREISVQAYGKGTYVFLRSESESAAAGFSSLGALGKKAEEVGEEAAREFLSYASSGACIDPHLADQLILYLATAKGESVFTTSLITDHLLTNLRITEMFTGVEYEVTGERGMPGRVRVSGRKTDFQLDSPKTDQ
jgi:RNA 3'-terminal phosphate cyclase (ATP)